MSVVLGGRRLGVDIGSLTVGCVLLTDGAITGAAYAEHHGDWRGILEGLLAGMGDGRFDAAGLTASGAVPLEGLIDSTLAVVEGSRFLHPRSRNILSIGGQGTCLLFLDDDGRYVEHTVNPPCAAGTGSFIEQQAERLGMDAASLGRRALAWTGKTPRIASRCAVFAKTDIVHAQQEGYATDAICAGLCDGVAQSLVAGLVKGRLLRPPVGVVGGVARNGRIVQALGRALGTEVEVSPHAALAGAIGAALLGREPSLEALLAEGDRGSPRRAHTRAPLAVASARTGDGVRSFVIGDVEALFSEAGRAPRREEMRYLGIDIGSTSTKVAILGAEGGILAGFYTATRGDPMAAIRRLAAAAEEALGGKLDALRLACTTGSGRKMIRALYGAEMEVDEISAHARAALELYPEADTIVEIGGQDSKYTRLSDGRVSSATMNYVCAAGTGSFIEEQARRLGLGLQEFADAALGVAAPYTTDRCTVYMERDLAALQADGWSKGAIAAAVLHSVRDNYIAKVVGRSGLGRNVVFQGATARNKALVAAFQELVAEPIRVSEVCHLTGALGAALLARDQDDQGEERSSSLAWSSAEQPTERESCGLCANRCQLTVVERDGVRVGWGMKCGREYAERGARATTPSEPERRRDEHFAAMLASSAASSRPTIGIPTSLYHATYAPLWASFLARLHFRTVTVPSGASTLAAGRELVNSDFCAPMILAHGQVQKLLEAGAELVFCPAIEGEEDPDAPRDALYRTKTTDAYYCYYSQYLPTIVDRLTGLDLGGKLIAPLISWRRRSVEENAAEVHRALSAHFPDLSEEEVRHAFAASVDALREARAAWGRTLTLGKPSAPSTGGAPRVILLGRPYVALDSALHHGIPRKIEELGAEVYWQEEVDCDAVEPRYASRYLRRMHWHYGKRILEVAEAAARTPDCFVVYLSCFRCSPDSFLVGYVKDIMEHFRKPYLVLQLDELASDVGYTTRLEAAMRSFRQAGPLSVAPPAVPLPVKDDPLEHGDTVLLPHFDDLVSALWVESFRAAGYGAVPLTPDERSLATGCRYTSGGECLPLVTILGAAVNVVRDRGLEPGRTFAYLPTICMGCNFPQFPILGARVLEAAGLGGVKVGLISSMAPGAALPQGLASRLLESQIVGSLLHKLANRARPYESVRGATEQVVFSSLDILREAIRTGADLRSALERCVELFRAIPRDESAGRKPRVALLGDIYVTHNSAANEEIDRLIDSLGGEIVAPSMTEYALHFYHADVRHGGDDPRHLRLMRRIEQRFEKVAGDLLGEQAEPDFAECVRLLEEYGVRHYLPGETSINVGRALYYLTNHLVEAIVHVNPLFCCPGVVSASLYRKMQEDFGVPIVDIFYDGTGDPNKVLIPHLHYLAERAGPQGGPPRGAVASPTADLSTLPR